MIGVVTTAEFPYGLRCAECDVELPPGSPYTDTVDSFIDDVPVFMLVCIDCEAK